MEMPELTPDMLLRAYAIGVFPMAEDRDDPDLFWVDPRMRGVIPLDEFHVPKRLRRTVRNGGFRVTVDSDFEAAIEACAESTEARPRTWINDRIIIANLALTQASRRALGSHASSVLAALRRAAVFRVGNRTLRRRYRVDGLVIELRNVERRRARLKPDEIEVDSVIRWRPQWVR